MILIIGLGNPGKKYDNTRHNVGFIVVDEFQRKNKFPVFKLSNKFLAETSEENLNGEKIILAKPRTFMNESGKSVKKLVSSSGLKISDLWVIHDDIDLPLGKIRIVKNRGAAGHKGVESIAKTLGTKDFVRFRIGIRPTTIIRGQKTKINVENFVLQKFKKEEEKIIETVIGKAIEAIEFSLKERVEKAMSEFNKQKTGAMNRTP